MSKTLPAMRRLPLALVVALLGATGARAYQFPDQNPVKQPKESFGDRQKGVFGNKDTQSGSFGTEGADGQFRSAKVAPVRRADAVPVLDARPTSATTVTTAGGATTRTTTTVSSRPKR